jgi:hypothetical protein
MYQQKGGYVPKTVLLDEIHVTVLAPRGLKEKDYEAMNRTLQWQALSRRVAAFGPLRHPELSNASTGNRQGVKVMVMHNRKRRGERTWERDRS